MSMTISRSCQWTQGSLNATGVSCTSIKRPRKEKVDTSGTDSLVFSKPW